jgi:hypothetical protein
VLEKGLCKADGLCEKSVPERMDQGVRNVLSCTGDAHSTASTGAHREQENVVESHLIPDADRQCFVFPFQNHGRTVCFQKK